MSERYHRCRCNFRMSGAISKIQHYLLESFLTSRGYIPVLRTSLYECHSHSEGVHPRAESRISEEDFFSHILVAIQYGAHLFLPTREAYKRAFSLRATAIVKINHTLTE